MNKRNKETENPLANEHQILGSKMMNVRPEWTADGDDALKRSSPTRHVIPTSLPLK